MGKKTVASVYSAKKIDCLIGKWGLQFNAGSEQIVLHKRTALWFAITLRQGTNEGKSDRLRWETLKLKLLCFLVILTTSAAVIEV